MAESYNRTLVEAKAAMLLIPKSARVLARDREQGCFATPFPWDSFHSYYVAGLISAHAHLRHTSAR